MSEVRLSAVNITGTEVLNASFDSELKLRDLVNNIKQRLSGDYREGRVIGFRTGDHQINLIHEDGTYSFDRKDIAENPTIGELLETFYGVDNTGPNFIKCYVVFRNRLSERICKTLLEEGVPNEHITVIGFALSNIPSEINTLVSPFIKQSKGHANLLRDIVDTLYNSNKELLTQPLLERLVGAGEQLGAIDKSLQTLPQQLITQENLQVLIDAGADAEDEAQEIIDAAKNPTLPRFIISKAQKEKLSQLQKIGNSINECTDTMDPIIDVICPMTRKVTSKPVKIRNDDKHYFNYNNLKSWIQTRGELVNPLTNAAFEPSDIVVAIDEYIDKLEKTIKESNDRFVNFTAVPKAEEAVKRKIRGEIVSASGLQDINNTCDKITEIITKGYSSIIESIDWTDSSILDDKESDRLQITGQNMRDIASSQFLDKAISIDEILNDKGLEIKFIIAKTKDVPFKQRTKAIENAKLEFGKIKDIITTRTQQPTAEEIRAARTKRLRPDG